MKKLLKLLFYSTLQLCLFYSCVFFTAIVASFLDSKIQTPAKVDNMNMLSQVGSTNSYFSIGLDKSKDFWPGSAQTSSEKNS